ncbi:MAG TPA: hypothetical protein VKO45_05575, partial [Methanomicrobiales archaeon]|nr:hypothetical protein [Methanomicrobiales archaeon]
AYPVELNVTSDHPWLVADGKDTAIITANVVYGTGPLAGQPIAGANVSFAVDYPWQVTKTFLLTNVNGTATTTFLDTRNSGTANITVTAWTMIETENWGYMNYSDTKTVSQRIDHTTPASTLVSYQNKVQVGNSTRISVLVKDRWGNPVDNRNLVETMRFVASSSGPCGFESNGSWVKSITVPVNASGYADVQYLVYPTGANYIFIDMPSPISSRLISIEGTAQSQPFSISTFVSPGGSPYPYTQIQSGKFTIGFTLYDRYGFPTMNQPVNITTNIPGESMSLSTNKNGLVIITYGPKDIAGIYTITATAINNRSVSVSQKVEFVSGAAADALLTASPQTMASRDVTSVEYPEGIKSSLIMRVMDVKGNPVAGEDVTFRFTNFDVNNNLVNQTIGPVLEDTSGVTSTSALNVDIHVVSDESGEAIVYFHPGAFTTDVTAKKYNASAEGKATVQAQWSGVKRQVTLKYINYRYLTIESRVDPTTVRVNESVDLIVTVRGDGYALQPKPIDVVLVTDRSGSMLEDNPDREVSIIGAASVFADQLEYSRDRLGQVTFGGNSWVDPRNQKNSGSDSTTSDDWDYATLHYNLSTRYNDYATTDLALSSTKNLIKSKIASVTPTANTPMRYGIFRAIYDNRNAWNPTSVRALILLTDGDYNIYGDPLARGSVGPTTATDTGTYYDATVTKYWNISKANGLIDLPGPKTGPTSLQNMSNYARSYNVRIYTIGFNAGSLSGGALTALRNLAKQTGGNFYEADATNIADVYTQIAGALRDEAGVNTTMNLSFGNVKVGNVTMPGKQVYSYQRIPGRSTRVNTWNASVSPSFPGYPKEYNQWDEWNTTQRLDFFIGTIRLGQTWESKVTFKVLQEGNINVFDALNSRVSVENNGTVRLNIPEVYITALPNLSGSSPMGAATLHVLNLRLTNEGSNTSMDLAWNLSYNGLYPISEEIAISPCGTDYWNPLGTKQVSNLTTSDTGSYAFDNLPIGNYMIRVQGNADDAPMDEDFLYLKYNGHSISKYTDPPETCSFGGAWPGWTEGIFSKPPPTLPKIRIS